MRGDPLSIVITYQYNINTPMHYSKPFQTHLAILHTSILQICYCALRSVVSHMSVYMYTIYTHDICTKATNDCLLYAKAMISEISKAENAYVAANNPSQMWGQCMVS